MTVKVVIREVSHQVFNKDGVLIHQEDLPIIRAKELYPQLLKDALKEELDRYEPQVSNGS